MGVVILGIILGCILIGAIYLFPICAANKCDKLYAEISRKLDILRYWYAYYDVNMAMSEFNITIVDMKYPNINFSYYLK